MSPRLYFGKMLLTLTIFLTPAGEELLSFLWSRLCMSECRVSTSNLHRATKATTWKYNHLVLI